MKPIYKDETKTIEERIQDLLGRMTLEEKVRQMDQYSGVDFVDRTHPAMHNCADFSAEIQWERVHKEFGSLGVGCIHDLYGSSEINNALQKYATENTRLGIPILFSEEGLHGLGRPGCSVFPQQIALAATWNPETAEAVGRAIAAETRSLGIHEVFSPVIDLARDARWGRMEETYGEDTCLSSRTAVAMVKGLQGSDLSSPDSVIAEIKHFSAYAISEGGLNCAPVRLGPHEHESFYLPVFEAAIREGGAVNVMCSYTAIDGMPCASNHRLLTGFLRDKWKMTGFVRADMCAILRLYDAHFTAHSPEEAIRQAVEAGVDMQFFDFSHAFYQGSLIKMVNEGVLQEKVIDLAVSRILRVKFMLGLFDQPYTHPHTYKSVLRSEKHGQLALEAARQSICLLKNEGGLLPLKKNLRTIAVIGPNADEARLGDYTPYIEGFTPSTLLDGIRKLVSPETVLLHVKGTGVLEEELSPFPTGWLKSTGGENGLTGEYFSSGDFSGQPVMIRTDNTIQFNWVFTKPSPLLTGSSYTIRWIGSILPDESCEGFLATRSYDSLRLWIDGKLVVNGWGLYNSASKSVPFHFEKGREYRVKLEYLKDANGTQVFFGLANPVNNIAEAVRAAEKADVAILALGDSPDTSGENFDRSELRLPGIQSELLQAVYATGTPVILVLTSGRPLALSWEASHIPAILEAWFSGEKGGQAIAEVLFGDYNPAGRLPVSFPRSVGQLPVYYSRKPGGGVKYVEGDWSALFPFGYGLSYTEFSYFDLRLEPEAISATGTISISFGVKNIGTRSGDEVVQVYLHQRWSSVVRPLKELKAFCRIHLEPGEERELFFSLGRKELEVLSSEFKWEAEPGLYDILIGPDSFNVALEGVFEVNAQ